MASKNIGGHDRVDRAKVENLEKRVEALRAEAQKAEESTAPRFFDGLRRTGAAREPSLHKLVQGLSALKAELDGLWDMRAAPVAGLPLWDGRRGAENDALTAGLDAWNPQFMKLPGGPVPAAPASGAGPVVLWPKTQAEHPLAAALQSAGIRCIEVLPAGQEPERGSQALSAAKALALYRHQLVGLVCTGPLCAPFLDAFANKLLLVCLEESPDEGEPGTAALHAALQEKADVLCTPGDASEKEEAARHFAALCKARGEAVADIVVLAAGPYEAHPLRPQQLARIAARRGRRVLFLSGSGTAAQTALTHKEGNLYIFELAGRPGEEDGKGLPRTADAEGQAHYRGEVEKVLSALEVTRALFKVDHPFWADTAFGLRQQLRFPILYDCYEDFSVWPGAPAAALEKAERTLLHGADFLVTASSVLAQRAGPKSPRSLTIRNGCDAEHFGKGYTPGRAVGSPAVLGYYGPLSGFVNTEVLRALDASGLDIEIRLVGSPDAKVKEALAACRKVKWRPAAPYSELPAALAEFDIALLPFDTQNPIIQGASPAKFYEYLAAGKPVVGTAVPELMVFRGRFACLEDDPGWFVRRVRECLDGISSLENEEARVEFARQNSWEARADSFEELYRRLELARGRAIRGDVWAEQAQKSAADQPPAPMLALPAPQKKNAAENLLKMQLAAACASNRELNGSLRAKDENTQKALEATRRIMTAKSHRFAGFTGRLRRQLVQGSGAEKKAFFSWLGGKKKETPEEARRYQPLATVQGLLEDNLCLSEARVNDAFSAPPGGDVPELGPVYTQCDLLFFPPLAFEARRERPQQLALKAAENGHRVFYFCPQFAVAPEVTRKAENLYLVQLPGAPGASIYDDTGDEEAWQEAFSALLWHFGIRDALCVVSHPGWVEAALSLRQSHGFKLVADCVGDFTGFLTPGTQRSEAAGLRLVESADVVIPCSEALATVAKQVRGGDYPLVRAGSDHTHFNAAYREGPAPAPAGGAPPKRPVIGYTGVVSHWFDAEAVCHLAKQMPEADIILAGQVVEWEELLRGHSNIKLPGERPYEELPALVATFDVCLLPFDPGSEVTQGADPTEFWDYLSAGKKVVAGTLPGLRHYEGEYLLFAGDKDELVQKVRLCLDGQDGLKTPAECAAFAAQNTWQARWLDFFALAREAAPSVSIILPTQNHLAACKACIQSVLGQTAYPRYELLVVDRASTDGTRACLEELEAEAVPGLRVMVKEQDPGYAAACNEAIHAASGQYIVLLQDDTLVTRGWLAALVAHLEENPGLALCGPATNLGGGEAKVPVYYRAEDELAQFAYLFTWHRQGQLRTRAKSLSFFCAALRKSALEACGFLDDKYHSEAMAGYDMSMAVQKKGLHFAVAEDAFVHTGQDEPQKDDLSEAQQEAFGQDRARYEEKWGTKWKPRAWRPGVNRETNRDCGVFEPKA